MFPPKISNINRAVAHDLMRASGSTQHETNCEWSKPQVLGPSRYREVYTFWTEADTARKRLLWAPGFLLIWNFY